MIDILTQEDLINYIEKYGDGDIYYSHCKETDGRIIIKYFPKLTKFVDESSIEELKKEIKENPHLKARYLNEIILTPKFSYIPNSDGSSKNPLVENYKKFLEVIKKQRRQAQKVRSKDSEYCR